MQRLSRAWRALRSSYWFLPTLFTVGAGLLAVLVVLLDWRLNAAFPGWLGWLATTKPDGARSLLSAVAGSCITVAGVAFSVIMVVLSLTSQQFGPRLLESFMGDTGTQLVFGTLLGTFLYCLLVLRVIHSGEQAFVPHLALALALLLALASVAALVFLIHHVSRSIQIGNILARVAGEIDAFVVLWKESARPVRVAAATRVAGDPSSVPDDPATDLTIDPPTDSGADPDAGRLLVAEHSGYLSVQGRTRTELAELARRHGVLVEILALPGGFVLQGAPLARVRPDLGFAGRPGEPLGGVPEAPLRRLIRLRSQRSKCDDLRLRFDQIVQVALRALSPSLSDPYTAETCLERLTDALRAIALAGGPPVAYRDARGDVRVVERRLTLADLVRDVLGPVRRMAADDLRVALKLFAAIAELRALPLDPDAREALRVEADLHGAAATARATGDDRERLEAAWQRALAAEPGPGATDAGVALAPRA